MSAFSDWEIRLLRVLSQPLPLTERPYAEVAEQAGCTEEQVLERVRAWRESGVIRRMGARVNHHDVGYVANGMSVWDVPPEEVDRVAAFMTQQREVSHCYLRPRHPSWPHNLYAMIHGESEDAVRAVAARIAAHANLDSYRVLFSSKEFKKSAPRYFTKASQQGGAPS